MGLVRKTRIYINYSGRDTFLQQEGNIMIKLKTINGIKINQIKDGVMK